MITPVLPDSPLTDRSSIFFLFPDFAPKPSFSNRSSNNTLITVLLHLSPFAFGADFSPRFVSQSLIFLFFFFLF